MAIGQIFPQPPKPDASVQLTSSHEQFIVMCGRKYAIPTHVLDAAKESLQSPRPVTRWQAFSIAKAMDKELKRVMFEHRNNGLNDMRGLS